VDVGVTVLAGAREHGARDVAEVARAEVARVVAGVQEGVLREADVDERGLHAGQDVRHDTFVDAPHDRAMAMPLEIELGEEITLLDSDPGFAEARIDDDTFAHGSTSPTRPPTPYCRAVRVSLELPHSYREEKAKRHEGGDHRGATVAHQRQRNPDDGQEPGHHPDVDQDLRRKQRRGAQRHEPAYRLARGRRDVEAPQEEQDITQQQDKTADEPPHLGAYGEDENRVPLPENGQPALRRAGHTLAQELARSNRDLRLDHVVRAPEGIAKRVQEDENPFSLVFLERQPSERHREQRREGEAPEELEPHPGSDQE